MPRTRAEQQNASTLGELWSHWQTLFGNVVFLACFGIAFNAMVISNRDPLLVIVKNSTAAEGVPGVNKFFINFMTLGWGFMMPCIAIVQMYIKRGSWKGAKKLAILGSIYFLCFALGTFIPTYVLEIDLMFWCLDVVVVVIFGPLFFVLVAKRTRDSSNAFRVQNFVSEQRAKRSSQGGGTLQLELPKETTRSNEAAATTGSSSGDEEELASEELINEAEKLQLRKSLHLLSKESAARIGISRRNLVAAALPQFVLCLVVFSYPYVIVPWFRAGDFGQRLFILFVIQPTVTETGAWFLRRSMLHAASRKKRRGGSFRKKKKRDPFRDHFQLMFMNYVMALVKRFMTVSVGTYEEQIISVAGSTAVEIVLRCTMVHRDSAIRWLRGKPPMGKEESADQNKVWSCSINVETTAELAALLMSPFARIFFARHAYAVDLGYPNWGDRENAELNGDEMRAELQILMLMLIFEGFTDFGAFYVEMRQGIPITEYSKWMSKSIANVVCQVMAVAMTAMFCVYTFKTLPTFLSCTTPGDPCSCSGWQLTRLHKQACFGDENATEVHVPP